MGLDRFLRDVQGAGDLAVGAALGQFGQDLALAGGEGVQAAAGPGGRLEQGPGRLGGPPSGGRGRWRFLGPILPLLANAGPDPSPW